MPRPSAPRRLAAFAVALFALGGSLCSAQSPLVLFEEDFEQIPLGTSPTYGLPGAWSPDLPIGWDRADQLPGLGDPSVGVTEFEGWNFWLKEAWQDDFVTGDPQVGLNRRGRFERGRGAIAVADPDTWNSIGEPAERGLYNTFLFTPQIDLAPVRDRDYRLVLAFDTSWRGGCCGSDTDLVSNQTAVIRASLNGGPAEEVFRWESAPFFDEFSRPTLDPFDQQGNANQPNANLVVDREFDDRVFVDFSGLLDGLNPPPLNIPGAAAGTSGSELQLQFAMEDAGDDGWWALDNLAMYSIPAPQDGDLYIDGVLDEKDITEFAFGLLDDEAYEDAWAGESPATRGSVDSVLDFDDIPWFSA